MHRVVLSASVVVVLAVPLAAPAAADLHPTGRTCAFSSAVDVTREAGWQVGQVNAGPLVTTTDGTLYCSIVLNSNSHSAPAAVRESVRSVGGVATMAPRPIGYQAAADDVALCTSWVPDVGSPLYWVSPVFGKFGYWSTDPRSPCGDLSSGVDDPECPWWLFVDEHLGTNVAEIWQDCEPYEAFDPSDPCPTISLPQDVCSPPLVRSGKRPVRTV